MEFPFSSPAPSFLDWLRRINPPKNAPHILLLDGGVSTFLENELAKKDEVFEPRELWSSSLLRTAEGRDEICNAHWAYRMGGADILSTVTYQCHYGTYNNNSNDNKPNRRHRVVPDEEMHDMIKQGIELAIQEGHNRYVAVSLGCYGAALADGSEYRGNYDIADHDLEQFHARKLKTVLGHNPTILAFETVPCVQEVRAIVSILQRAKPKNMACWISLACQDGDNLNDGTPIEEALDVIHDLDPDAELVHAVGVNCCGVQHVKSLLVHIVQHPVLSPALKYRRGLVCYPNSGEAWDTLRSTWRECTGIPEPKRFAATMFEAVGAVREEWKEMYRTYLLPRIVLGGCCRTTPKTINALKESLLEDIDKRGYTT